jgi:hypothetical protein
MARFCEHGNELSCSTGTGAQEKPCTEFVCLLVGWFTRLSWLDHSNNAGSTYHETPRYRVPHEGKVVRVLN